MNVGQIYGSGTGITADIPDAPNVPLDAEESDFWREVEKFKGKADEAYTLWQRLRAKRQAASTNPELLREYNDVIGQAENIQAKISDVERITAAAKSGVVESITSWFGLEGYNSAIRQPKQLGLLPVLAVAAVAAAVAWLGSWIIKGNIVDRKLTAVENMIDSGVDPRTAGALIEEKGDPGPFSEMFGNLGTGIAVAGVVAMALYFFVEKKRGF